MALFAGAGGGILGGKLLGWKTVCAVEWDTFRAERLAQRQNEGFLPPFPIWNGDIAAFDGKPWRGIVDVVSGGFPCQDISAANPNAEGITGARSSLWKEMRRIIREVGPQWVVVENSPMLAGRGLGTVLGDLAEVGYDAKWGVLGGDDLGGFQIRKRMFIVGRTNQKGLEGLAGNGNAIGQEEATRHVTAASVRPVADASEVNGGKQQQLGIDKGARSRNKSRRRSKILADSDSDRKQQSKGAVKKERERTGYGDADCLWLDREFIECKDGKIRATKPGLCGMADGVANRVDRISAIGDGQIPVVVAAAWEILSEDL